MSLLNNIADYATYNHVLNKFGILRQLQIKW